MKDNVNTVTAEDALNVLRSWIGLSRSQGSHKVIIDTYNNYLPRARGYKVTYKDAYCDTTISAVFIKLNAVSLIGATECGVQNHVAIFKKTGIWIEDGTITPKVGDIVVYSWATAVQPNDSYANHIGMVEKVQNGRITAIEGNMNGGVVGRREFPVGWGYIRGYARPKYSAPAENKTTTIIGNVATVDKNDGVNKNKKIDYAKSFDKTIAKTYTTTANLRLRAGASLLKDVLTVMPKGSKVTCYGYYTDNWYYVVYKDLVGFCSKNYLK